MFRTSYVPVGTSAADNVEVRRWGAPPKFDFQLKPHWEVGEAQAFSICLPQQRSPASVFAVYKGWAHGRAAALANFFFDVHTREHATQKSSPFSVNTASLMGAGQLPKFAADLFKIENSDFWPHAHFRSRAAQSLSR